MINWFLQDLNAEEECKEIDAVGDFLMEGLMDMLGFSGGFTQSSSSSSESSSLSSVVSWVANDDGDFKTLKIGVVNSHAVDSNICTYHVLFAAQILTCINDP